MLAAPFSPAPALGGARADEVALYVSKAAQHRYQHAARAGGSVGPRFHYYGVATRFAQNRTLRRNNNKIRGFQKR
jgi:hypothetical protein